MPASSTHPTPRPDPPHSSAAPSRWRRQHGAIEAPDISRAAFRPFFKASTPLDKLAKAGLLSPRRIPQGGRVPRPGPRDGDAHRRDKLGDEPQRTPLPTAAARTERAGSDAIAQSRAIATAFGEVGHALVRAVLIEEARWCEIARRYRVDSRTAKTWCRAALRGALAAVV
jgi:hypothetical protein